MASVSSAPLSTSPAIGQTVEQDGKMYTTIREGKAYILIPPNTRTSVDPKAVKAGEHTHSRQSYLLRSHFNMADASFVTDNDAGVEQSRQQDVFYNPIQQFNRDLSVLAIAAFGRDLCEKRKARHERSLVKAQTKQEKKRKRKEARQEKDDGKDGSGKLMKMDDGSGLPALDQIVDRAQALTDGTPLNTNGDGGVSVVETEEKLIEDKELGATNDRKDIPQSRSDTAHGMQDKQSWTPRYRILDALSATGLRALRYASEIPFATAIVANDMDRGATKSIKTNAEYNRLTSKITVTTGNAIGHMYRAAYPLEDSHGPHHISGKYDVIDLDPYGTAAPFIDSALQALNDGGLLCVTCTDSGVFASCGYSEKTYSLYGGMPVKGPHSHEGGLRLILNSIASSAARYGMAIEPLLSLSIDFYVRMFVRVTKSPADVKFLSGRTMIVYDCDAGCGAWHTQMLGRNIRQTGKISTKELEKNPTFNFKHSIAQGPSVDKLCEHCHSKMHIAGPMWAGPLHNASFVEKVLSDARAADKEIYQTKQRIEGMLDTALDELIVIPEAETLWRNVTNENSMDDAISKTRPATVDLHPFFFIPSALSKVIHCVAPPEAAIKGAIRHLGYRATRSHCKPGSIKTDAPWNVIWEIMREWVRQKQPIKEGALKEGLAGWNIMQKTRKLQEGKDGYANNGGSNPEISTEISGERKTQAGATPPEDLTQMKVVFDEVLGKDKPSGKKLVRYQQNPRENWGPMTRAKGSG